MREIDIKVKSVSAVIELHTRYSGGSKLLVLFGEMGRPKKFKKNGGELKDK